MKFFQKNLLSFGCLFIIVAVTMVAYHYYALYQTGRVLNIYCWNESFRQYLAEYYPAYDPEKETIGDVKVRWIISPNANYVYQRALNNAVADAGNRVPNDRIDMFMVESDEVRKYCTDDEISKNLSDLGITADMLEDQFPYTKNLASDNYGHMRGIAWQATPGVVCYRRDIARAVFGTDDPAVIQSLMKDWGSFEQMAVRLRAAGYRTLPGLHDTYRAFWANAEHSWLTPEKYLQMDSAIKAWLAQTELFTARGYNSLNNTWDVGWCSQVKGSTFCYFLPPWAISQALIPLSRGTDENPSGTYGEWGVCQGPAPFYWGGTWICAYKDTDNAELIADIMKTICLNKDVLRGIAVKNIEFVNDMKVMEELASASDRELDFFHGQNPYPVMLASARKIRVHQVSGYDHVIHEAFKQATNEYLRGKCSWDGAWQRFLAMTWYDYPELQSEFFSYNRAN